MPARKASPCGPSRLRPRARRRPRRRRGGRMRARQARHVARRRSGHGGRAVGRAEDLSRRHSARRPRSDPHLRRRPGRTHDAAGAQGARRAMRARDLLRYRPQGRRAAGVGAPRGRGGPHRRPPHLHPSAADADLHERVGGARRHSEGHDRGRARRLRPGFRRRRADRPRQAQAARAVLPLSRLR